MFDKEGTTKTAHPDNRNHALSSHTRTSHIAHTHGHMHGHTHGHTHTHTQSHTLTHTDTHTHTHTLTHAHTHTHTHTHTHACMHARTMQGGGGVLRPASSSDMSLSLARSAIISSSFLFQLPSSLSTPAGDVAPEGPMEYSIQSSVGADRSDVKRLSNTSEAATVQAERGGFAKCKGRLRLLSLARMRYVPGTSCRRRGRCWQEHSYIG